MQRIEVGVTYALQAPTDDIQKVLTSILDAFEERSGLSITRLLRVESINGLVSPLADVSRVRSLVAIAGEFRFLEAEPEDNPETRNDPDY